MDAFFSMFLEERERFPQMEAILIQIAMVVGRLHHRVYLSVQNLETAHYLETKWNPLLNTLGFHITEHNTGIAVEPNTLRSQRINGIFGAMNQVNRESALDGELLIHTFAWRGETKVKVLSEVFNRPECPSLGNVERDINIRCYQWNRFLKNLGYRVSCEMHNGYDAVMNLYTPDFLCCDGKLKRQIWEGMYDGLFEQVRKLHMSQRNAKVEAAYMRMVQAATDILNM